jgi:hypothetical protein
MLREAAIAEKFETIAPILDEAQRRIWAATEALAIGYGGIAIVHRATGMARSTIKRGLEAIESGQYDWLATTGRSRRIGGGRKPLAETQPGIVEALDSLVDPVTRGDPQSPLRWTTKSTKKLARALCDKGFRVSDRTVARLLHDNGYSLQSTRKRFEGSRHEDRDSQFQNISRLSAEFLGSSDPVISVDTKKKELVGPFKAAGREWQPKGTPVEVNVYDFPSLADGKAIPYGIYDVGRNEGYVSVGVASDTAEFAVESIRSWWEHFGRTRYPNAQRLFITADCGGSNGNRCRLWKLELQTFADETGIRVRVAHYPPGTSKWNKIEHRLFCWITANWRGRPLTSFQTIVDLIGSTETTTGLKVFARLDPRDYQSGRKVANDEMASLNIKRDTFRGEWNYVFLPRSS